MKKSMVIIMVIVVIILIVAGAVVGYLYFSGFFNNKQGRFPGGNFQLNQSQIDDVASFFNSNPSQEEISNYCKNNMENCFYYCRSINPEAEYCKQLNTARPGNLTRDDNFSERNPRGQPPMPQPPQ